MFQNDTFPCDESLIRVQLLRQSGIAFSGTTKISSFRARIFGCAVLIFAVFLLCTAGRGQSQSSSLKPQQKGPAPKASPTPAPQSANSDQLVPDLAPDFLKPSAAEQQKQLSDIGLHKVTKGIGAGGEKTSFVSSPFCNNGRNDLCYFPNSFIPPNSFISVPRALSTPKPKYTKSARKARLEGTTVLQVIVGADGKVYNPKVLKSLSPDLDAEAMIAMKQWKFQPSTLHGQPVAVIMKIEVAFSLY